MITNETNGFINQGLVIQAKQTEVAFKLFLKNEAKWRDLFQNFVGAKQNDGNYAKTSKQNEPN